MTPIAALMTDEEVAAFGRRVDTTQNGFGALECSRGLLPLTAMQLDARVCGVMAAIDLAQTFVNTTGCVIEATYIFPLPDRMAVHRFRMEVAGRTIEGVIDERGAARQHYDEAIAAGHRAAITEEERAGVFTLRVGNLMPGEVATVRLSLVGPLPVDDGEITFRFPLVVSPRYMPGARLEGAAAGLGTAHDTDAVPDASRISPPVMLPGMSNPVRLAIRVAIEDAGLRELASSLDAVTTTVADAQVIELQPGAWLDRDFILRWRNDAGTLASSLVCSDDADGLAGTFMLTLVPPSTTTIAAKPRDVVFVIDRSGSMEGWKMVAARRAVGRMIDSLTSRDTFCVLAFDNTVEAIPSTGLALATDRERFRAVEALAKIDARGGTEMTEPLVRALDMLGGGDTNRKEDRERIVMFVTDGQVGNEDGLLHELAPRLRNARMFTLGVDQAVNAAFLRRLAAAGGGLCELVESEDRLDAVMAKIHRRIATPIEVVSSGGTLRQIVQPVARGEPSRRCSRERSVQPDQPVPSVAGHRRRGLCRRRIRSNRPLSRSEGRQTDPQRRTGSYSRRPMVLRGHGHDLAKLPRPRAPRHFRQGEQKAQGRAHKARASLAYGSRASALRPRVDRLRCAGRQLHPPIVLPHQPLLRIRCTSSVLPG